MSSVAASAGSSAALKAIVLHAARIYSFSHSGHGLPTSRSGFLAAFSIFCLGISLTCQFAVILSQPERFGDWPTAELASAVLILYLPMLVGFFAQRPENTFSLCLLYLVFSLSGALGALLMPLAGGLAAVLSLSLAGWAILAYLAFTPVCEEA